MGERRTPSNGASGCTRWRKSTGTFLSTQIPNQAPFRYSSVVSWFRGDRFPDAQKLVSARNVVSVFAKKKLPMKELLLGVDVPFRTKVDLESITGERW